MKFFITVFLLLTTQLLPAQGQGNWWYFGDSVLIDFNSGVPVVVPGTDKYALWSSAALSDAQGNLLLYTNGVINNANHQAIANSPPFSNYSNLHLNNQGLLLLPIGDSLVYQFNHYSSPTGPGKFAIYYSEIEPYANGSQGAATNSHIFALDSVEQQMAATRDASGEGWWIISHDMGKPIFRMIHVLPDGSIQTQFQTIGSPHVHDGRSELTISPSGSKVAVAAHYGKVEIFDFDRCTGELSFFNAVEKDSIIENWIFGISFSPNEKLLYVSDTYYDSPTKTYQYCLDSMNLMNSEVIVWETPYSFPDTIRTISIHELGPDGKIYISQVPPTPVSELYVLDTLAVIHSPDLPGLACDLRPRSLPLPYGKLSWKGNLPNMPNYRLGPLAGQIAEAGPAATICAGEAMTLGVPDTVGNLVFDWWPATGLDNPSSPQPSASPAVTTTYYLMVTDTTVHASCATTEDSVTIMVIDTSGAPTAFAGEDSLICRGDSLRLGEPPTNGTIYSWSPMAGLDDPFRADPLARPTASGWYELTAYDLVGGQQYACRTDVDSVYIEVEEPLVHPYPSGKDFCPGEELQIGLPPEPGFRYRWDPPTGLQDPYISQTKVAPEESILYTLIITDLSKLTANCRERQDPVFLNADDCLLQNVITPNGDGINDVLDLGDFDKPVGLTIYDRWGKLIYHSDAYGNDWSGSNLPESTYYYRVHVRSQKGGDKVAYFDLIR